MPLPRLALALAAGVLALLALPARAADDVPRQMVFQGRLVRADGSPETSAQDLRFALYPTPTGGAPVWEESHPGVPVSNGYYSVVLGAAQPLPDSALNGQPLYLGVSLVGQSELTPRLPVVSVPYALKAGDSAKLEGLGAASFAPAEHSHASVPYALKAGNSDELGGIPASSYSRTNHTHAVATSSASGFMSSSDKAKLDGISNPSTGSGLRVNGNALSVNFTTSGGNNGTATTVARGDHSHAAPSLSCTWRRASSDSGTAVSYCATYEVLSGGTCAEFDDNNTVVAGGQPVGITLGASASQNNGQGFRCTAANPDHGVHATAVCCRLAF